MCCIVGFDLGGAWFAWFAQDPWFRRLFPLSKLHVFSRCFLLYQLPFFIVIVIMIAKTQQRTYTITQLTIVIGFGRL